MPTCTVGWPIIACFHPRIAPNIIPVAEKTNSSRNDSGTSTTPTLTLNPPLPRHVFLPDSDEDSDWIDIT